MALSDDLSKLTSRAKEAEDRAAATREKAKADLEADRDNARAVGEQQAEDLRELAAEGKGRISARWADVQRAWNDAIAGVHADIQGEKEEHDLHKAQRQADQAEEDARFAIALSVSLGALIAFVIVIVVYQQIENYVLQPTIIGRAAQVSGFTVIVSVLVFGSLFGVIGAIIGVPISAGIQIVAEELTVDRRARIAAADAGQQRSA